MEGRSSPFAASAATLHVDRDHLEQTTSSLFGCTKARTAGHPSDSRRSWALLGAGRSWLGKLLLRRAASRRWTTAGGGAATAATSSWMCPFGRRRLRAAAGTATTQPAALMRCRAGGASGLLGGAGLASWYLQCGLRVGSEARRVNTYTGSAAPSHGCQPRRTSLL